MNKPAKIATAVAVALGIAYPASAWLLGKQVESALDAQYQQLTEQPYVKVVERTFERGVFHSTEVVTFELNGELLSALARAGEDGAAATEAPLEPVRFTVRSEIAHGPLPGLRTIGAATAEAGLVLDEAAKAQMAKMFGDAAPVQLKTVYGFSGGGSTTLTSPAFKTSVPAKDGGERHVSWQGLKFTVDFTRHMQRYSMQGEAPGLEIEDGASHLVVTGIRMSGDQSRVFEDEPLLYAGSQKIVIDEVRMTPRAAAAAGEGGEKPEALLLKQVAYDVSSPAKGEFVDISAKLGAETVQVGAQDYGPAHYDLSLNHLHARTVAKLSRAVMSMYSDEALRQARQGQTAFALAALAEPARELLAHDPEISIDRISFRSPHGDATMALRVRTNQLSPDDLQNPFVLIGKLDVSGNASLPEGLIADMQKDEAVSAEEAARRVDLQLAGYAAQGLVQREQGFVKTALEFRGGELKINGKPVNPFALGAAAGSDGAAHAQSGSLAPAR
ncbi:YdgA family protein [Azoarcus sp. KH32C]|uniref:YdgA family protein n=1 Tax=Azoarcus sp. KH32C TaxID=748247 RepID=UPI00023868BB|nr:YdgA family protein [Azoarcus sp. KH32C]BAL26451.1 hypothetical protein AZKH_4171 [Azoarcus sp. KH32C]